MTSIKDKLASSVRQAKAAAPSKGAKPSRGAKRAPAKEARQASTPPEPERQPAAPARVKGAAENQEPATSTQALFPDRVWPD